MQFILSFLISPIEMVVYYLFNSCILRTICICLYIHIYNIYIYMCLHIHIHICIHIYIYIYLAQHLVYSKYSVNDSDYYNQHYFTLSSSSRLCWYHVHTTFTSHCTYPPALAVEYQQLTAASFSRDLLYSIETICSLGDYGSLSPRDSLQPMTDPYAETKGYLP